MEPGKYLIRSYTQADEAAVIALLRLNTPQYFAPEEEEDLRRYLRQGSEQYFVLEYAGEIAGCGGFNLLKEERTGRISWDIFHPTYQGLGLGTTLTRFRIEKLRANADHIVVRTSQLAYRFYEKQGFVLREKVKDFWAPGYDLYLMELAGK
ncbi:MAG: GNAT family N-acetyltransferase [Bacteroidia bacterium]|nr:GNAT family N-acetyltransferase [Bacteroidia bacterium]